MKKLWAMLLSIMLVLSVNLPLATQEVQAATISDVSTKNSKYAAINWAVDQQLMSLYAGNRFAMTGKVQEAQLLQMFGRLDYNYSHSYTTDMLYNYYADLYMPLKGATSKAKRTGLVTRGDFAVLYAAMRGYDLTEKHAVQYLYTQDITTGKTGKRTYEDFAPAEKLTRADAAVFLYRASKKGKLQVDGFTKKLTGKDNKKVTLPPHFVEADGESIDVDAGNETEIDPSANVEQAIKAVQSIKVDKKVLIANGQDYTAVSVKLKDSKGKDIPYTKSLKFRVTSEYFDWKCDCENVGTEKETEIFQQASAVSAPYGSASFYVYSDGPDVNFYFQAPRMTKSLKDNIILELVDETASNYATYQNKQIKIPIEYIPQPELRLSYEVFDATVNDYVGGNEPGGGAETPDPLPGVAQGPLVVTDIDLDKKQFTRQIYTADEPYPVVKYEHAEVLLAGYRISERIFERIIESYLEDGGNQLTLQYMTDSSGFPIYDLPFAVIPSEYTSLFANDSQSYAVLLYLIDLLPSSVNDFSMAYYDSVKTAEMIARQIPSNMFNVAPLSTYRSKINGLYALAELADQTLLDEQAASRPENMPSYTKLTFQLVAPGGQIITNYRGSIDITYGGKTYKENFTQTGGKAIKYLEGLTYGTTEVEYKLTNLNQDTRYKKLLAGLEKDGLSEEIVVQTPISEMVCTIDMEAAFLIDKSGSMNGADPKNELNDKVEQLVSGVASMTSSATGFTTKATTDAKGSPAIVENIVDFSVPYDASKRSGGTKFATGIQQAVSQFESDPTDRSVQRIIFLISDGKTKESVASLKRAAEAGGAKVYTVSMGEADQAMLEKLALDTGGKHFHISDEKHMNAVFNTLLQSLCGGSAACPVKDGFETAEIAILRTALFLEAKAHCEDVERVKVKLYSVDGTFEIDLKYLGENMFAVEYALNKIKNFNVYNEIEFFAYDKNGKQLTSQRRLIRQ